jgi:hypothetical protein
VDELHDLGQHLGRVNRCRRAAGVVLDRELDTLADLRAMDPASKVRAISMPADTLSR